MNFNPQLRSAVTRPVRHAAFALVLAAGLVSAATVHADWDDESYSSRRGSNAHQFADGNLVDVQVQVDGATTPLYFRPGRDDRHYFQAFKGRNYSLVVRNTTSRRIGVLIVVDGLNVVNGKRSPISHKEPMYVLDPHERAVIRGWRSSLDEVRRFVFVDEERSYAERTGQSNGDMGWIRVLSYRENRPNVWYRWNDSRDDDQPYGYDRSREESRADAPPPATRGNLGKAAPGPNSSYAPEAEGPTAQSVPGTGWGERRHDPVQRTTFDAARQATDEIVMRYEYAAGLRALGIHVRSGSRVWQRDRGELGFAQPPRW